MTITIHSKENFAKMRAAGLLAAQILDFITPYVKTDVTTDELNTLCHNKIIENGAIPAPLNYKGFPKSICTSINHVICHGIPNEKPLKDGDMTRRQPDISKMREILNRDLIQLEQGIEKVIASGRFS